GQAQEEPELHRAPEQRVQRRAAGVLEDKRGPALVLHESDGTSRPCGLELARKRILMPEPFERGRRGMLGYGSNQQDRGVARRPGYSGPASIERERIVGMKRLEDVLRQIHHDDLSDLMPPE